MHDVLYFIIVNSSCDRHMGGVGKQRSKRVYRPIDSTSRYAIHL
jgi:hypothetical protein